MENKQKIWHHWIMALGAASMLTQLVFIREFLSVFHGNELVIGITMAIWLIATAMGALCFQILPLTKLNLKPGYVLITILGVLPIAMLFLFRYARSTWFITGVSLDIIDIALLSILAIAPYCLLSGYLFPAITHDLSNIQLKNPIQTMYYLDTFGAVLAGAAFSFVLLRYLSHIQTLCLSGLIFTIISIEYCKFHHAKTHYYVFSLLLTAVLLWMMHTNPEIISKKNFYKNQEILFSEETPYGNITVTKTNEQINFFENGALLFSGNNKIDNEEAVHYAVAQHANPKKILLVGGGASGVLHEIMKYPINRVDYVEINPTLIETGQFFTSNIPSNNKINIIQQDARNFIKKTQEKYDIVLIHLNAPHNLSINRYYTYEFFRLLKEKLNTNGIASIALQGNTNYLSTANTYLFSSVHNAIQKNFSHVKIFAGYNNYFIMSDNILTHNITDSIINKNINNTYVNQYYIDSRLLINRHKQIMDLIKSNSTTNTDMHPVSAYFQLIQWLTKFKINKNEITIFVIILIIAIIAVIIFANTYNSSIFTGGFTSISLELIYLLIFQTIYGYIYDMLSIIITIFMLGIGMGVLFYHQFFKNINWKTLQRLHLYLAIYSIITPAVLFFLNQYQLGIFFTYLIIIGFTADIAIVTGMIFAANSQLYSAPVKKTAAQLYGFDLLGAAAGAILITALLLPLFGFVKVCIFIAVLNILMLIKSVFSKKKARE